MKKSLPIICFSILYAIICHAESAPSQSLDGTELLLGDGYLTYDHMSVGGTALKMDATKVFYSSLQSTIILDDTTDLEQLATDFNIDISASGGWGNYSGSAKVHYLHHIENDKFTENFSYVEKYFANALLDISALPPNINALNPDAFDVYTKNGVQAFTNKYGDTFIRQMPVGAFLVVNLRLNFASALDKEKFDTAISGKFGSIFSASVKIEAAVQKTNAQGVIEVSAYQLGGDPSQLPYIFSQKTDDGYFITNCNLSDIKSCKAVINGVILYAQSSFSGQIRDSGGGPPTGKLAVVGEPVLETYANKFSLQPAPPLDPNIVTTRLDLANEYATLNTNKKFIDHYIDSPSSNYFTPAAAALLHDMQTKLNWNWSLFDQFGAIQCYQPGEEQQCFTIFENVKKYSKPIDETILNFYKNNGYDEIDSGCMYVPVGVIGQLYQNYAYYCDGNWLDGSFIFYMSEDKQKLSLRSDWRAVNGHHINLKLDMTPDVANQTYAGVGTFHDLTMGLWYFKDVSIRLTQNKV